MQQKNVSFEQLADIMAFRIIVADVAQCYQALGLLHGRYQVLPQRFKDYISVPKPNGYRSLHTGVIGPHGQRIEIQIRTAEMQEQAERGVAAHWIYKQGGPSTDAPQYAWLRSLIDILDKAPNAEEFLEHTKLEMFQDQVFCFTPKGKLIALPRGATPIDFAYAVHSQVGDTCVGAKINGRMLPLRTQLANGDQIEIVTSKAQTPSPTWERFVVTGKAKAAIRRFIRVRQREQYLQLGRSLLDKTFHEEGYEVTEKGLDGVKANFKQASDRRPDRHCRRGPDRRARGADGGLSGPQAAAQAGRRRRRRADLARAAARPPRRASGAPRRNGQIAITGLIPGMAVHFARCCHPLPGDRIVGIITTGKGVTIHTIDCATLESFSDTPERWIDVGWDAVGDGGAAYTGRLKITVGQPAGQPVEPVDRDRPARGQHLQPAHRQPLDGFLRHGDRRRGRRREASRRHHRGAARDARDQRRRARAQLSSEPARSPMSAAPASRREHRSRRHHPQRARRARCPIRCAPPRSPPTAGADGITAHLREDRRHIVDADIDAADARARASRSTSRWRRPTRWSASR